MKIIKTGIDLEEREKANEWCRFCPCCGCMKSYPFETAGGIKHTVSKEIKRDEGDDTSKIILIDCYECPDCGAEWQSEPYSGGQYL